MLFIDGEELSVRYDMNSVLGTYSICAAMSGAMSILWTPGRILQVNNWILVERLQLK
jgi:hypothetical protein